MYCYQCQETAGNTGCRVNGVCGKKGETAILQDLLIFVAKGVCVVAQKTDKVDKNAAKYVVEALFSTVTNVNFDNQNLLAIIKKGLKIRDDLKAKYDIFEDLNDCATWSGKSEKDFWEKAEKVGVLATKNEDTRSLNELLIYGLKGIAAYVDHALILGYEDQTISDYIIKALASTTLDLSIEKMIANVLQAGEFAIKAMKILDKANTQTYGHPQRSQVNIGVGKNPAILISGHDLKDIQELLEQTDGTGVDVYTHGEMLPAHYYPAFKKYSHFVGNYGNAWHLQNKEFVSFNGPILMTTNCLVPPGESYKKRVFTTGLVSFPDVKHIDDRSQNGVKDFLEIITLAKTLPSPQEIETGQIVGGFAHNQVFALSEKVVNAVKSGLIKKFVVMAGCDGRQKGRNYYTDFAKALPKNTIILTAGCAKFRYNKLNLGDIGGIPRVLDAGQCNDSYSLVLIALKLQEIFKLKKINDLPIIYNIAWYEQKAVTVLLALLHLGVKNIHLGPSLPAFLSRFFVANSSEFFG